MADEDKKKWQKYQEDAKQAKEDAQKIQRILENDRRRQEEKKNN